MKLSDGAKYKDWCQHVNDIILEETEMNIFELRGSVGSLRSETMKEAFLDNVDSGFYAAIISDEINFQERA